MKTLLIPIAALLLLAACKQSEKTDNVDNNNTSAAIDYSVGKELIETNCYACHNPNSASHDDLLAPPFVAIKKRYSMQHSNEADFVSAFLSYVQQPDSSKALMKGAIDEFGVMAPMPIGEEKITAIAQYLYNNEPAQPEWFQQHFNEMHGEGGKGMGKGKGMH